jgi:hypothetical protein
MSFEVDLMSLANEIKDRAIYVAVEGHEQSADFGAHGGPEGYYQPIVDAFRPFSLLPDPAPHEQISAAVSGALRCLSQGDAEADIAKPLPAANLHMELIPDSEIYLATWTGRAAEDFKRNFIETFRPIAKNQYMLGAVLRAAMDAQALMWQRARENITDIAQAALKALYALPPAGFLCCSGDGQTASIELSVVGAVAAISAIFTDGLSEIVLTVVAATAGAGTTIVPALAPDTPAPRLSIGGEHSYDVVASMSDAMKRLHDCIVSTEQRITTAMLATEQFLGSNMSYFVANKPMLAGATAANVATDLYMGYAADAQ